jgi:hypothetical protein
VRRPLAQRIGVGCRRGAVDTAGERRKAQAQLLDLAPLAEDLLAKLGTRALEKSELGLESLGRVVGHRCRAWGRAGRLHNRSVGAAVLFRAHEGGGAHLGCPGRCTI